MFRLVSVLFVVVILTVSASAQVNPFRWSTHGLQDEDVVLLVAAAQTLYQGRAPVKNSRVAWENPATGNSGIAKIAGVQAGPPHCIAIAHQISLKGKSDPQVYVFKRCRSAAGTWELTY